MTLTAFAGWKIIQPKDPGRPRGICFVVVALGFAGGFLAKGPEALLPLLPLLLCAGAGRKNLMAQIGVSFVAGLIIVLLWSIPAYVMTQGDYWRVGMSEGVGERMVTGLQGHGASTFGWYLLGLPLYLLLFWLSALPWSPLLVIHRKKLFAAWKRDATDIYLLLNAGLIFVVFSLMVTKLPHYTLPAFPFLALLFARRWITSGLKSTLPIKLAAGFGIVLAFSTIIVVPLAIANHATPSPVGQLVRDARDSLTPDTEFALVDFQEPNAIWQMRRTVKGYGKTIPETDILPFLNQPGPHAVVLSTALWQRLRTGSDPSWKVVEARGWNAAKGRFIELTLVVKP